MFPDGYIAYLECRERRKDAVRAAERHRLARQAGDDHRGRARPFRQVLLWLGDRLITWGERLRERYDTAGDARMLPAIDRSQ